MTAAPHWTARDAEANLIVKQLAEAEKHDISRRCAWCGWTAAGSLTRTADDFARHIGECADAPPEIAKSVRSAHTVTKRKQKAAEARLAGRQPQPPKPATPRETIADRRAKAKTLYDAGRTVEQIAAEVGVCVRSCKGYLLKEGIKLPPKRR